MPELRVARTESATGWTELVHRLPDPRLADLVHSLCGYRERSSAVVERRMSASSRIPLIISFGEALEVDMAEGATPADRFESFVAGLHAAHTITRYQGAQFGIQVDLTPLGAFRLLAVPGSALAHQVVRLAEITPKLDTPLSERLAALGTWAQRFALVDEVLAAAVAVGPEPDPMVSWMWRRLEATGGLLPIAELVAATGMSHRHVTARFREQVGLAPKAAAGIFRFERAARAIASGEPSLADVAAHGGYADQSHLTRAFGRLAGATPMAFGRAADLGAEPTEDQFSSRPPGA